VVYTDLDSPGRWGVDHGWRAALRNIRSLSRRNYHIARTADGYAYSTSPIPQK